MTGAKIKAFRHLLALFLEMIAGRAIPANDQREDCFRIGLAVLRIGTAIAVGNGLDASFRRPIVFLGLGIWIPLRASDVAAHRSDQSLDDAAFRFPFGRGPAFQPLPGFIIRLPVLFAVAMAIPSGTPSRTIAVACAAAFPAALPFSLRLCL